MGDPFVTSLLAPEWKGDGHRSDRVIERPEWADARAAIERLNGANFNDVYLYGGDSKTLLSIGGDSRGKLLVQFSAAESGPYWLATDDSRPARDAGVVIGGQLAEFPERHLLPLAVALAAAEAFYRVGEMAQDIHWEPV